ncbi:MAG: plasmid stabilization protein [Gammaproteobacteria bacterium]|nr:MAG: plasmid stabilization protein [Gammaproteobacteria bacterium]PCJ48433.1 MAG: plasmid stabilization protein [Gammaproteobacteria bacterium]
MLNYYLTPDAKTDLIDIRRYTVKKWGIIQSQKYISELHKTILVLAENALIGIQRQDIAANVFSFPYISHVIYYVYQNDQLVIFGILHKGMVPANHLGDREIS